MPTTSLGLPNSTTVRATYPSQPLPARLELLEQLWPSFAVRLAEYWFFRPGKRWETLDASDAALTFEVDVRGVNVSVAGWGAGPAVVALHGWAGGGAQFQALRRAVTDAGYSFFTFDAPAHGGTEGRSADVVVFAETLRAVADRVGPVHAVVGHSLGATATALAMSRGLSPLGVILVAPMPSLAFALEGFARLLGLRESTRERLEAKSVERAGLGPDERSLFTLGPGTAEVLLVHDRADRVVPVERTEELARRWPHAELHETERRGHNRVLDDSSVAAAAVRFLERLPRARRSALDRQLGELDRIVF